MKPTAETEKEVLELYHKYWNSYLNGDVNHLLISLMMVVHIVSSKKRSL